MADVSISSPSSASMAEQDARLNARIAKARGELAQISQYIGRGRPSSAAETPPSSAGERLLQLSRSETSADGSEDSGRRTDRMRLAELSDQRQEQLGRAAVRRWNPRARPASAATTPVRPARLSPVGGTRVRSNTSPRTSAKLLGAYSKDFVQQALDFDGVVDDEEEVAAAPPPPVIQAPSEHEHELVLDGEDAARDARSPLELRKYVQQMEETIAQLVQQKDELLRNQAEFDKHASGIFPSLETLNHQLSQLVQGKLVLQTSQTSRGEGEDGDAGAIDRARAEDVLDELRVQRAQIQELEAEAKRRKYDADLQEQSRAIEMTHVTGQIVGLVASGKLTEERSEMLADALKKVERELGEASRGLLQRYQLLDKRVNQLHSPLAKHRLVPGRRGSARWLVAAGSVLTVVVLVVAVAIAVASMDSSCGWLRRCRPLS